MRQSLFHVDRSGSTGLQTQIREILVAAILSGHLAAGQPVPSTRGMADRLKVSRNTVTLAYQALAADGFLESRERSGFYVAAQVGAAPAIGGGTGGGVAAAARGAVDWSGRLRIRPTDQANIRKPAGWASYPFPFIYGQADPRRFPIAAWRDCTRQAMTLKWLDGLTSDRFDEDDPMLVEQIARRILPRRGLLAAPDEILITLGAQNALHLIASLLVGPETTVAVEDPGYPDMRNIFALQTADIRPVPVDADGLTVGPALEGARLVFTTPSHQFPTNVTMTLARRRALLDWAEDADALVVEDDYEFETNYRGPPTPALKSLDRSGRVLYVGSLSKSMMPGLRLGFLVAPAPFVAEARALRRLMLRHPPGNNQRAAALFLALGHHDAQIARMHRIYQRRWLTMHEALEAHFPGWAQPASFGGTSFWMRGPAGLDAEMLARAALAEGVVIEPAAVHFLDPAAGGRYFRLGFSSIAEARIARGIEALSRAWRAMAQPFNGEGRSWRDRA